MLQCFRTLPRQYFITRVRTDRNAASEWHGSDSEGTGIAHYRPVSPGVALICTVSPQKCRSNGWVLLFLTQYFTLRQTVGPPKGSSERRSRFLRDPWHLPGPCKNEVSARARFRHLSHLRHRKNEVPFIATHPQAPVENDRQVTRLPFRSSFETSLHVCLLLCDPFSAFTVFDMC